MTLYKLVGLFGTDPNICDIVERKKLKISMSGFGEYILTKGIFNMEGEDLYMQYMLLERLAQDANARKQPQFMMHRCETYPQEIKDIIKRQAFNTTVRRDTPLWARTGRAGSGPRVTATSGPRSVGGSS